jgi:hypothetical protein
MEDCFSGRTGFWRYGHAPVQTGRSARKGLTSRPCHTPVAGRTAVRANSCAVGPARVGIRSAHRERACRRRSPSAVLNLVLYMYQYMSWSLAYSPNLALSTPTPGTALHRNFRPIGEDRQAPLDRRAGDPRPSRGERQGRLRARHQSLPADRIGMRPPDRGRTRPIDADNRSRARSRAGP